MTDTITNRHSQDNRQARELLESEELKPRADLIDYMKAYARQKPAVAALWCLGVGFVLGWKLKPW